MCSQSFGSRTKAPFPLIREAIVPLIREAIVQWELFLKLLVFVDDNTGKAGKVCGRKVCGRKVCGLCGQTMQTNNPKGRGSLRE
ncbi:hypothetical protein CCP2SC5_300023 [Azospirillaceae bacterium]